MKGGAKSRKRLTKKSQNYGYTAPRLKDGEMTRPSIYTYDPSVNVMDRNEAVTNFQRRYRGKKTRSKYDMNSNWYKGFPTEAPEVPLDLQSISRITDTAIQDLDSRVEKERIQRKRDHIDDIYSREYDKLGKLDKLKYNWGKYYSNIDINHRPTIDNDEFYVFEKKNYETLKKISDKKKYWQQKLDNYDPNRVTDTERFNIRNFAHDISGMEEPEKYKDKFELYYKGKYFDENADDYKYLPDYKVEEIPSLSPLKSDDSVEYSIDDELLIPREDIIKATDYYKNRKMDENKLDAKYDRLEKKYDKLETELDDVLKLDIEKCLHAKKMAKSDIKLYKDPFFIKNYYEPCSDNENLTQIYIDTFYSLPWELIKPVSEYERLGESIDDTIYNIPLTTSKNGLITEDGQQEFRTILRKQGLTMFIEPNIFIRHNFDDAPIQYLLELSNFYRWAIPGNIKLVHLPYTPSIYSDLHGKTLLQETFNMLDDAFEENPEYFNGNVEKVKRYFILRLIGIIGNPEYPEILEGFIDSKIKQIDSTKINIEHYKKELKYYVEMNNPRIKTTEIEKNISKNKLYYFQKMKINENKLRKLAKDLKIAKRFSRITSTPKDYITGEAEKLVYE
jgi:hypothetical protein